LKLQAKSNDENKSWKKKKGFGGFLHGDEGVAFSVGEKGIKLS